MTFISSKDNRIVKDAAALQDKKYRDRTGLFLLEGPNPIREAMEQGGRFRFIFTRAGTDLVKLGLEELCGSGAPALYELAGDVFERISDTETSQGVIAVAEKTSCSEEAFFAQEGGCVLVLDRLQDPGNMGTLLRSAEAMGFAGVMLIKGCTDPWSPKVARAAAGSLLRLPMLPAGSGGEALQLLKTHGKTIYCAAMGEGSECYRQPLAKNAAIIIGNEGGGASAELRAAARPLSIPMEGRTESLNAAVAGSILMYESLRQRYHN